MWVIITVWAGRELLSWRGLECDAACVAEDYEASGHTVVYCGPELDETE